MKNIRLAYGTIQGADHLRRGMNNQDAFTIAHSKDCIAVVVCDGCGSGKFSEVGARLGAALLGNSLTRLAQRHLDVTRPQAEDAEFPIFDRARQEVLSMLHVNAMQMGPSLSAVVDDYLLFTVVGALITPLSTTFFWLGDGTLIVNGTKYPLGPFENNAPPYLSYGLVESNASSETRDSLRFITLAPIPTSEVQNFLVGTDGVEELDAARGRKLPGKTGQVPPLSEIWTQPHFFTNPDMINRLLRGLNAEKKTFNAERMGIVTEHPILKDDTTLIVGQSQSG